MSMTDAGGDRGVAPPKPLFASSWLALFVLLRQELESLRDAESAPGDQKRGHPQAEIPEQAN